MYTTRVLRAGFVTAALTTTALLAPATFAPAAPSPVRAAVSAAAAPAADAPPAGAPLPGPVFGYPNGSRAEQYAIVDRLIDNINAAPPGSTIRMVMYSFTLTRVADAFEAAYNRGVNVCIVINGHSRSYAAPLRLETLMGSDVTARSFVKFTDGSARGTSGVTHQKSVMFSRVGNAKQVVMVGSTNLTAHSAEVQYSDMYTTVRDQDVWRTYLQVFNVQKLDVPQDPSFIGAKFASGAATFFPLDPALRDASHDPMYQYLAAVPNSSTSYIRISNHAWNTERGVWLAELVASKALAGVQVDAILGQGTSPAVESILRNSPVRVRSGEFDGPDHIHTKLTLLSYVRDGKLVASIITGSDNFSDQSLRNDDNDFRIDNDIASFAQYVYFFNNIWERASV